MDNTYKAKQTVQALQWTGTNLNAMKELLANIVESNQFDGVEVYADWVDPYVLHTLSGGGYFMLKFYAGDDIEVDPSNWVVVYDDTGIDIMRDKEFHTKFEKS